MKYALKPLAACMAAAFGVATCNVWGESPAIITPVQTQPPAGPDTPAPTISPVLVAPPPASALPDQSTEFPGIPWGSFLVYPELSLAATYDDNIYAERTNVSADFIYTVTPSLALKSKWTQHALNLDLGLDSDHYRSHDSEDVTDYWLGLDGHYDLGANSNLFGGARHSRDHEDRSTPGSLNPTAQVSPTQYFHDEAHLGLAHSYDAFRLRLGGTYDKYNYEDGVSSLGVPVDNDYRDHTLDSLGARLGYVLSPQYELFGQFATDNRNYDILIPGQTYNRDSDGYRAAIGLRFTLQPQRLVGEVFAGAMSQDYAYSGYSDISQPYFGALAVWKPTSQVTATGFIDRTLEETNVNDGTVYASGSLDTTYGFEVEHQISSKLSVNGRAAYTRSDFQNYDRLDTIIDAGAGLRYFVASAVYLGADLRITNRDSNDLDGQYASNQIMVNIGYTPARNRDYSIIPEAEAGAPEAPRTPGLYSGFYLGAQLGHGALTTATLGPRDGGGFDEADMGAFGESYALFGGWGTEVNDWYLGVELDAGDSNASWYHNKTKLESVTTYLDKDSSYGLSARVGYLLDGGMLYAKLGAVSTNFHTYYTENQYAAGAYDQKHDEVATRFGMGMEIPASRNLFVRVDYGYARFDSDEVPYQSDTTVTTTEKFDTSDSVFSVGLGWRFGDEGPTLVSRSATELRGLYLGASLGYGTLGTRLTGTHYDSSVGPYDFTGEFANSGFSGGIFTGYGYTFDQVFVGLELDGDAANFGWYHDRETGGGGGRDFSVEKTGSYGATLRIGYVVDNGSLLYGQVGAVQTRFNTTYNKGNSAANWIDRSDTRNGTRFGLGAEIPATESTFIRMDYSYTRYGDSADFITTHDGGANPDAMSFENSENLFRLGLGFRF
jgi:outer membrane protein W